MTNPDLPPVHRCMMLDGTEMTVIDTAAYKQERISRRWRTLLSKFFNQRVLGNSQTRALIAVALPTLSLTFV
jgi:hypothetical protein